jgi:diguanylate cyclase (GGDEF)-like protein
MVLLFSLYAIFQQFLIKGLRRWLTEQIALAAQLEVRAEELHHLALQDPLTGLNNRRAAEEQLRAELARSDRHDYPLTLLLLDLDGLKTINDRFGHPVGDQALQTFARQLRKAVRSSDIPARIGGDEFMVLLPECTPELVPRVVARLTGLEIEFNGKKIPLSYSAGWTGYEPGQSAEAFLAQADQALYANKRSGTVQKQVRQVQAQLLQAQKMEAVGRLAGGVAHDFNNLLTIIKGYGEVLTTRLAEDDSLHHMAEEAVKAADRGASLIQQLMAFSRRQELQLSILNVNAVVTQTATLLRRVLGENIEFVTVLDPGLGTVKADRNQLERVIMNLATNARDAMPKGGRLAIKTANVELDAAFVRRHHGARPGSYILLAVSDTGTGMDKTTRARIFEPFFTTKQMGRGTGLGLASVFGIVKQSGGYIWVDSEPGEGATFGIYLPRRDPAVEAAAPASPAAARAN